METIVRIEGRFAVDVEHLSASATAVTVTGDLDVYTAPLLRSALVDLIQHHHVDLLLDLSGVPHCDSTGFGVLVGALKRTRVLDGGVFLVAPTSRVVKGLRISALQRVFPVHATLSGAEEALVERDFGRIPGSAGNAPARQSA